MNEDSTKQVAVTGLAIWKNLRPIVVITAELSTLLILIGSTFSIVVNSILFERWDINYLSIASANDILISGIDVFIDIAKMLLLLSPITFLFFIVAQKLRTKHSFLITSYFFSAALFASWIVIFFFFELRTSQGKSEVHPTDALYLSMLLAAALLGLTLCHAQLGDGLKRRALIAGAGAVCIFSLFSTLFTFRDGKIDLFVKLNTPIAGCFKPKAVWIGSQSIVARCYIKQGSVFALGEYAVVDRSDAVLLSPTTWDQHLNVDWATGNSDAYWTEN